VDRLSVASAAAGRLGDPARKIQSHRCVYRLLRHYFGRVALHDARFWWPIIPFLIAYSLSAVRRLKIPAIVVGIYCVWFVILGFGAIAYSTRISFSGCDFPQRYGAGDLTTTYRAAFDQCRNGGSSDQVNVRVLRLLREYR